MDSKVIAALIGAGGVSIGALLGGIGYYLKSRAELHQTKKLVLYHLLEIRHLLKTSYINPKQLCQEYIDYCRAFFEKKDIPSDYELPENLVVLIEKHLKSLLATKKPTIDENFIASYESSLKELCKTDPVLAFKLRGKEKVEVLLQVQKEYADSFMMNIISDAPTQINNVVTKQVEKVNDRALRELINDIDKDISSISLSCSIFTWVNCKRITMDKTKPTIDFDELGLGKALADLFSEIERSMQ